MCHSTPQAFRRIASEWYIYIINFIVDNGVNYLPCSCPLYVFHIPYVSFNCVLLDAMYVCVCVYMTLNKHGWMCALDCVCEPCIYFCNRSVLVCPAGRPAGRPSGRPSVDTTLTLDFSRKLSKRSGSYFV